MKVMLHKNPEQLGKKAAVLTAALVFSTKPIPEGC